MLRTLTVITLSLISTSALCQQSPVEAAQGAFSALQGSQAPNGLFTGQRSPEAILEAMGDGSGGSAAGQAAGTEMLENVRSQGETGGIADPKMAAEWQALRESLDLGEQDRLYFFISFSMPESLIRGYALDAARAGGELVLRGVEPGMNLRDFTRERLLKVLRPGGMTAPIQIDPRLFDTYDIDTVPTIVLAKEDPMGVCQTAKRQIGEINGQQLEYQGCPKGNPEDYWKAEGSVTALYALEEFSKGGASNAEVYINALKGEGAESANEQTGIASAQWETLTDELAERNAQRLRERYKGTDREVYDTPMGPAVGPAGQNIDHLREE